MMVAAALCRWVFTSAAGRALGLVGLALAVLAGAFLKGRADGRRAERVGQMRRRLEEASRARKIERRVAGRSPAENRERLRKWVR